MDDPKNLPFGYPEFPVAQYSAELQETEDEYTPVVGDTIYVSGVVYECTNVDWDREESTVFVTYKEVVLTEADKLQLDMKDAERVLTEKEAQRLKDVAADREGFVMPKRPIRDEPQA